MIKQTYKLIYKEWGNCFDYFQLSFSLPEVVFGKRGISDMQAYDFYREKSKIVLDFSSALFFKKAFGFFFFEFKILGVGFSVVRQWDY